MPYVTSENAPRPPQQKRSRAAMERILQAAQTLIAERGIAGLTIADVAELAGVSVGSVYSRFSGKEALITATQERWLDQVTAYQQAQYADAAARSADFDDFVAGHLTAVIAMFRQHADLIREFAVRTIGRSSYGEHARRRLQEAFTQACDAVLSHPGRPPHVDRVRVSLAMRAAQATLEWRVTTPPTDAPDNDWDVLTAELPRLTLSYLREPPS